MTQLTGRIVFNAKTYAEMSLGELQDERNRIEAEIRRRVLGDPRQRISIGPRP